ncbi:MAG TPA: methyltransferase domain-containing protein, partial [Bacteroidia bacterium]|nr:methyltransferase domain-containing protein [Bacteroidia bacterium]
NQNFDAIMMNHVLEHSINPKDFLVAAYQKLKLNGKLLVRIPMADSIGFEKYKENWVGMEAPRHIHLFTQKSFSLLAKQIGFKIYKTKFDSIGWHFLSSEGYKKGVFLKDQRHTEMYSAETIQIFEQEAASANKINKGDTCAFYLEKI